MMAARSTGLFMAAGVLFEPRAPALPPAVLPRWKEFDKAEHPPEFAGVATVTIGSCGTTGRNLFAVTAQLTALCTNAQDRHTFGDNLYISKKLRTAFAACAMYSSFSLARLQGHLYPIGLTVSGSAPVLRSRHRR